MLRPAYFSFWKNSGISFTSVEIIWFGTVFSVRLNQNLDICVKIAPLSFTSFFKITSNAEILSVAAIIKLSPLSYTSRTFPSLIGFNSCMFSHLIIRLFGFCFRHRYRITTQALLFSNVISFSFTLIHSLILCKNLCKDWLG